jgi:hypothetical protein
VLEQAGGQMHHVGAGQQQLEGFLRHTRRRWRPGSCGCGRAGWRSSGCAAGPPRAGELELLDHLGRRGRCRAGRSG